VQKGANRSAGEYLIVCTVLIQSKNIFRFIHGDSFLIIKCPGV
jgi:hypothetical protein